MPGTFDVSIEQAGATTSKATVRSHTLYVDRPVAKGGADKGPLGGEYMVVALAGCFTSHLLAAIRAREAAVSNVKVAATGTLDGTPERFTSFTLTVSADCEDADVLRKVTEIAERACQVVNTLRQSTPVAVIVHVAPPLVHL
jgi:putative redox protein